MSDSSKSEKATPQRRKKAREQGQVARSRDLANVLAMAAIVSVLVFQTPAALGRWRTLLASELNLAISQNVEAGGPVFFWSAIEVFRWTAPAMFMAFLISLGSSVMQGGFVVAPAALAPKFERLSPANKLGQMFSIMGMSGLLKSLIPFSAIVVITVSVFQQRWCDMVQASTAGMRGFVDLVLGILFAIAWKSGFVLLVWSGIDYAMTWWKMEGDLKMSQQDIRQEHKENEGDPMVKGRMRRIQRQARRNKMLRDSEKATVVVVNPTHFAVALKYDVDMSAPIVLAKGRDLFAQQIKEVAYWHDIPVMENPPLAQALYRTAEVGCAIPAKLYHAVAEILAFVFRAQARAKAMQAAKVAGARNSGAAR